MIAKRLVEDECDQGTREMRINEREKIASSLVYLAWRARQQMGEF
jgi:hypothetical protein